MMTEKKKSHMPWKVNFKQERWTHTEFRRQCLIASWPLAPRPSDNAETRSFQTTFPNKRGQVQDSSPATQCPLSLLRTSVVVRAGGFGRCPAVHPGAQHIICMLLALPLVRHIHTVCPHTPAAWVHARQPGAWPIVMTRSEPLGLAAANLLLLAAGSIKSGETRRCVVGHCCTVCARSGA